MAENAFRRFVSAIVMSMPGLVLVPIAIVNIFSDILNRIKQHCFQASDNETHEAKVMKVCEQVRKWFESSSETREFMCTARPAQQSISNISQTLTYKKRLHNINLGSLCNIINVDTQRELVRVEPGVRIGELNDQLIAKGWMLPVVPELDDLTVGGLVMGGGLESTSHKHGFFQYTCKAFEVVLPDGTVITCTENEHADLYASIPWSYGTLAFLTAVDIKIVPYKKYVKLLYRPMQSLDEAIKQFQNEVHNYDSVEMFMFSKDQGVLMLGNFVNDAQDSTEPINRIGQWHKKWFYTHVETILHNQVSKVEFIPTKDFFHRHNRSLFWLLRYLVPMGNHPIFRWLLGWTMPPKHAMLHRLRNAFCPPELLETFILQDFIIPCKHVKHCIELCDKEYDLYPIWLCPTRHSDIDLLVDVGVYGFTELFIKKGGTFDRLASQRRLEQFTIESGGFVGLYAETAISKTEFLSMFRSYNKDYDVIRRKYGSDKAFPHVYDKISTVGRKNFCSNDKKSK